MNKQNEDYLVNNFPNLFPPYNPLYPMGPHNTCFSFDIGDGWFDLMVEASAKIEKEIVQYKAMNPTTPVDELPCAVQVKEKFGTLRFYMSYSTPAMDQAISRAEARSCSECEECGQPGILRGGGWLRTLCDAHAGGRKAHGQNP